MFYQAAAFSCNTIFKSLFRLRVIGRENIPTEGAILLCPNHIHNLDPILIGATTYKIRKISFMAKSELFQNKVVAYLLRKLGVFPVSRGNSDRKALMEATRVLRERKCLGIFPEGKRSKSGTLQKGMNGAAMFALKNNAKVIPVAIKGTYKLFSPLTVEFGKPVNLEQMREEKLTNETIELATSLIMKDIDILLNKL